MSDVQNDAGLPACGRFLQAEPMEGHGLHVGPLVVTGGVDPLAPGHCVEVMHRTDPLEPDGRHAQVSSIFRGTAAICVLYATERRGGDRLQP